MLCDDRQHHYIRQGPNRFLLFSSIKKELTKVLLFYTSFESASVVNDKSDFMIWKHHLFAKSIAINFTILFRRIERKVIKKQCVVEQICNGPVSIDMNMARHIITVYQIFAGHSRHLYVLRQLRRRKTADEQQKKTDPTWWETWTSQTYFWHFAIKYVDYFTFTNLWLLNYWYLAVLFNFCLIKYLQRS